MGGMTISHIIFDHGKLLEPAKSPEIFHDGTQTSFARKSSIYR
jgi:hypothetical protein